MIDRLALILMAVLAMIALAVGGYWTGKRTGLSEGRAEATAKWNEAALVASQQAREREKELHRGREIVEENYRLALEKSRAAAGAARGELGRLRDEIDRRDRRAAENPGTAGSTDGAAAEREVLRACAEEIEAMARDADAVSDRVAGLQEYVRGVIRPQEAEQ